MFELFFVLFGGIFYAYKLMDDSKKTKASNELMQKRDEARKNIEAQYEADYETQSSIKDFILNGTHYEEICIWLEDDFRYALGSDWKDKLRIPPKPLNPNLSKRDARSFQAAANHITWVYHLLLARQGKIDSFVVHHGYPVGGISDKDMNIKFIECIERRLLDADVRGIDLVLELDGYGSTKRTPDNVCGGNVKIKSLCCHGTHKLW